MKKEGQNFECYSKKLYGFLVMKGIRYERKFRHNQTNKWCWVYIMNQELSDALVEWKSSRPNEDK